MGIYIDLVKSRFPNHVEYGDTHIVTGGQKYGADGFAMDFAGKNGQPITIYNADWQALGRAAGPIRNQFFVRDADVLIAAPSEGSKGTVDCINKFKSLKPTAELIIV